MSAIGSSGTSVDEGQAVAGGDEAVARSAAVEHQAGLADAGLAGDEEEPGAGLEVAAYGGELGAASGDPRRGRGPSSGGVDAASQRSWKRAVSPRMASTRSSRVPQAGSLGVEKAWETVVWETPVSRARARS